MSDVEPDFTKYSLEELYDARANIDRTRYRERFDRIENLIRDRIASPEHQRALQRATHSDREATLRLVELSPFVGLVLIAVGGWQFIASLLNYLAFQVSPGAFIIEFRVGSLLGLSLDTWKVLILLIELLLASLLACGGYGFWKARVRLIPPSLFVLSIYGLNIVVFGYGWVSGNQVLDLPLHFHFVGIDLTLRFFELAIFGFVVSVFEALRKAERMQPNQPLHHDASGGLTAAVVAGERRR